MTDWPQAGHTLVEWTPRAGLRVEQDWLTPAERQRRDRQVAPLGERWAAARCWVRERLALRLGCAPGQVPLLTEPRGRLAVAGARGTQDFNVSHTDHLLVLALAGHRVGVDIETLPPAGEDLLALAAVVGTPREVQQLALVPASERGETFARWWVRKEAVLKADGAGFLSDPTLVHVGVSAVEPPPRCTVLDHGVIPSHGASAGASPWPRTLLATAHDATVASMSTVAVHARSRRPST